MDIIKYKKKFKKSPKEIQFYRKEIARTRGYGDYSENAELHANKAMFKSLQKEIIDLKIRLQNATIRPIVKSKKIDFGCTFSIKSDKGKVITYTIVGDIESDHSQALMSCNTIIAQKLHGLKKGDSIMIGEKNQTKWTIIDVNYDYFTDKTKETIVEAK